MKLLLITLCLLFVSCGKVVATKPKPAVAIDKLTTEMVLSEPLTTYDCEAVSENIAKVWTGYFDEKKYSDIEIELNGKYRIISEDQVVVSHGCLVVKDDHFILNELSDSNTFKTIFSVKIQTNEIEDSLVVSSLDEKETYSFYNLNF